MKKITLILLSFLVAFSMKAQLQEEGFSSTVIPPGWTAENLTSGCAWQFGFTGEMPDSGNPAATFPTGAAFFDDTVCGNLSNDYAILTGPAIDVSTIANAELEVVYNLQVLGLKGTFIIEVFDGANWQEIFSQNTDTPRDTGNNQTINLDVTAYLNSAFQVRLIYDDGGGKAWGLAIDNYKLTDTSVAGIEDLEKLGFNYYPNPVSDKLQMNAINNIDEVKIFNLLGQEVLSFTPKNISTSLDLTELPIGTYIFKVYIDSKMGSFKIFKQ